MLSGQQKHKNAYDMITLRIRNTMEFYRFLNEEKKKKSRNGKVIVMNDMKYLIESVLFSKIEKEKRSQALQQMDMLYKKVPKETEIIAEGEILDYICILLECTVRSEKLYRDGDVHIIQYYSKGNILGLEGAVSKMQTSPVSYISNENCVVALISLKNIQKSDYSHEMKDVFLEILASDNIKKMNKIEILAKRGMRDRILIYFDLMMQRTGSNQFHLNMNREQFARFLGVNRCALSDELNKMKKEKIIDFHKNDFTVLQ